MNIKNQIEKSLKKYLPEGELKAGTLNKVKTAWERWRKSGKSVTLDKPFSGNVSQQGIGSVRYAFNPKEERTFDLIAGDKMGPPALNLLIQESVFDAVDKGAFENGLVFEIWDLKPREEDVEEVLKRKGNIKEREKQKEKQSQ